jgi:acetyltransferase-like isoleucine patch superfamily enzyme
MLGVKVGSNLRSFPITTIENPRGIHIGNNVWISKNVAFYAMNGVRIGNDVTIAKDVSFISGDHGFSGAGKRINEQTMEKTNNPIEIQDDVWVGEKAIILKNVTIGKGSVVGAGTVVTKSVDPYSVVAGNPAKVIKTRRQ